MRQHYLSRSKPRNRLSSSMIEFETKSLQKRKKMLNENDKEIRKCWKELCSIIKQQTKDGNPEETILGACLETIVKQRISLEREMYDLRKIAGVQQRHKQHFHRKKNKQERMNK